MRLALSHAGAWTVRASGAGYCVLTKRGARLPVQVLPADQGVIVGDLFRRAVLDAPVEVSSLPRRDVRTTAQALIDDAWGRYVALFPEPASGRPAVLRSPGGALEVLTWRAGRLTFVASQLEDVPVELPDDFAVDWRRLGDLLRDNSQVGGALALSGVEALEPGVLRMQEAGRAEDIVLWRPDHFAHGRAGIASALEDIRRIVEGCVAAHARQSGRMVAEISGGLDSAIVASSLVRAPAGQVVAWVNHHALDRQGDERPYARAVAGFLQVPLTELPLGAGAFDLDVLASFARGARPSLTGLDQAYDRATADMAARVGASTVLTGQGGDTVFFQIPTPLIVADHLRREGWRGLHGPVTADIARWTKRSAWSVLRVAAAALAGGSTGLQARSPPAFLARELRAAKRPIDLETLGDVPPAKRRQLQGLFNTRLFQGACARSREVDLIHPLLSQPIVEFMLGLSSVDLTRGGRDRALVREAFAGCLPQQVIGRRSKGVLSTHYERVLAKSLPQVRPFLLDGRLAQAGLVDRSRLEAMLTAEHLLWRGAAAPIMRLAAIEAWTRHWAVGKA